MKSYCLLFFLPLLIVKYSTANTVEPFHEPEESVNSQFYLPPPPGNDDPAFRYDKDAYFRGYAMKDSPRWKQAAIDADVSMENIARIFSPVIGVKINPGDMENVTKSSDHGWLLCHCFGKKILHAHTTFCLI